MGLWKPERTSCFHKHFWRTSFFFFWPDDFILFFRPINQAGWLMSLPSWSLTCFFFRTAKLTTLLFFRLMTIIFFFWPDDLPYLFSIDDLILFLTDQSGGLTDVPPLLIVDLILFPTPRLLYGLTDIPFLHLKKSDDLFLFFRLFLTWKTLFLFPHLCKLLLRWFFLTRPGFLLLRTGRKRRRWAAGPYRIFWNSSFCSNKSSTTPVCFGNNGKW